MNTPTKPPTCLTCAFLNQVTTGTSVVLICLHSGVNAYAERANPNGCGPGGVWWVKGVGR